MMWEDLHTTGTMGSENGTILLDEEYKNACRITLEKCERYYAITCGIYGGMVHTAFADNDHYREKYEAMKKELQEECKLMLEVFDNVHNETPNFTYTIIS